MATIITSNMNELIHTHKTNLENMNTCVVENLINNNELNDFHKKLDCEIKSTPDSKKENNSIIEEKDTSNDKEVLSNKSVNVIEDNESDDTTLADFDNKNVKNSNNNDTGKLCTNKIFNLIDSDSEEDYTIMNKDQGASNINDDNDSDSDEFNNLSIVRKSKHKTKKPLINDNDSDIEMKNSTNDSDSDSDSDKSSNVSIVKNKLKKRIKKVLNDSDSEQEKLMTDHPDSDASITELANSKQETTNIFKTLIDSDSESEEDTNMQSTEKSNSEVLKKQNNNKHEIKHKKGSLRASKEEAMRQIHSETQRLLRESEITLPYHRPKQRTLQEFLNRKKVASILPKAPSTAAKLKMSSEIVSKALEEKEKEVEMFYKSSDSEEEAEVNESMTQNKILTKDRQENVQINESLNTVSRKLFNDNTEFNHLTPETNLKINCERSISGTNEREIENSVVQETEEIMNDNLEKLENTNFTENGIHKDSQVPDVNKIISENDFISDNLVNKETFINTMDINEFSNNPEKSTEQCLNDKCGIASNIDMNVIEEIGASGSTRDNLPNLNNEDNINVSTDIEHQNIVPLGHVTGLPPPDFISEKCKNVSNIKSQILSNIPSVKPTLKGIPGMVIDLTQDIKPKKKGVNSLLDRFFSRHSFSLKPTENITEISVINVKETENGLLPVTEVLPYTLPNNEKEDPELSKPGAKLKRLKEELQLKMALKRNEEWKQKEQEEKLDEEDLDEDEDIIECVEKEKMINKVLTDSEESEPEENDIIIKERSRTKCMYADEEAEESEDADDEINDKDEGDEEEDDEKNESEDELVNNLAEDECGNNENEEDHDCDNSSNSNDSDENREKPKKLKRIIRAFDDDSNHTNDTELFIDNKKRTFQRTKTDFDIFETDNDNDTCTSDIICQQNYMQTDINSQIYKTPLIKKNILNFVSPITQLTALNSNLNSDKKSSTKKERFSLIEDSVSMSVENTPVEKLTQNTFEKRMSLQKKLFHDTQDGMNEEDLEQLCSGEFVTQQNTNKDVLMDCTSHSKISETQLEELCSGKFETQAVDIKKLEHNELSEDLQLVLNDNSISPIKENSKSNIADTELSIKPLRVISSSDEDDKQETSIKRKRKLTKKKVKKLELSDDEDVDKQESEEESEEDIMDEEDEEKYVDYDSEENEIVVVPKKDIRKVAATFLENEAELSESDWDSADEDEKGLDKLEIEEGDNEDIDENQMRDELGKMHMKQVLDEDQREVKLLKELLFEDGDLYTDGAGRERKFRWKNINKIGLNDDNSDTIDEKDGWVDHHEDENELEWRKMRHEREKFLQEKKKDALDEIEEDLGDSEIFKLGVKALKKIKISGNKRLNTTIKETEPGVVIKPGSITDLLNSTSGKKSHALYKHSLLAKGEDTLARIATIVKDSEKSCIINKNTRHFVFTHISPSVKDTEESIEEETESKENSNTKVRKRKASEGFTPKFSKRTKIEENNKNKKKLF